MKVASVSIQTSRHLGYIISNDKYRTAVMSDVIAMPRRQTEITSNDWDDVGSWKHCNLNIQTIVHCQCEVFRIISWKTKFRSSNNNNLPDLTHGLHQRSFFASVLTYRTNFYSSELFYSKLKYYLTHVYSCVQISCMSVHAVIICLQRRLWDTQQDKPFFVDQEFHPENLVVSIPWILYSALREES
jgi:hypothetical protein